MTTLASQKLDVLHKRLRPPALLDGRGLFMPEFGA